MVASTGFRCNSPLVSRSWVDVVVKSRREDLSTLSADPLRALIAELITRINAATASGEVSDEEACEAAEWIGNTVRFRPDVTTQEFSISCGQTFNTPLPEDE